MTSFRFFISFFVFISAFFLRADGFQTIQEKKDSLIRQQTETDDELLEQISRLNSSIEEKRFELSKLYEEASLLHKQGGSKEAFSLLAQKIKNARGEIREMQSMWQAEAISSLPHDPYALWHHPQATISEIVIDFGGVDSAYIIPPEIGAIQVCLNSSLPIPYESWGECLELVLARHGIGVRALNPFLKELYFLNSDPTGVQALIEKEEELDLFSSQTRVSFLLSTKNLDLRRDFQILQKFSNPSITRLEMVGGKILISSSRESLQELLKVYHFVTSKGASQEAEVVSLSKINGAEMAKILTASCVTSSPDIQDAESLRILTLEHLPQSLFLSGSEEEVKKALQIIQQVESKLEVPGEKTVFWYTAKHSEAEELASVLSKVYNLILNKPDHITGGSETDAKKTDKPVAPVAIGAAGVSNSKRSSANHSQSNFVVDPKTGAIIMVVEQNALGKMRDLVKKLDVPKKMVQLEVLLFEKKMSHENRLGLNLLRLGSEALQKTTSGLKWLSEPRGVLEFLVSHRKGSGIPAYDLAYKFLLGQDDVQINASPSIITTNQTPATIAIVEEISIDGGANDKNNRIYNRAQYGITLQITPTISTDVFENSEKEEGFVTLDTDITFDTPSKNLNDRPDVTRRHIKNHVRIADGETLILGGLRRKTTQDSRDSIPFLGEIPGLGKLFGSSVASDSATEMFIFITPKIVHDPALDIEKIRVEQLKKRPGDVPEYLNELLLAQTKQKHKLFEKSFRTLFDTPSAFNPIAQTSPK